MGSGTAVPGGLVPTCLTLVSGVPRAESGRPSSSGSRSLDSQTPPLSDPGVPPSGLRSPESKFSENQAFNSLSPAWKKKKFLDPNPDLQGKKTPHFLESYLYTQSSHNPFSSLLLPSPLLLNISTIISPIKSTTSATIKKAYK